MGSYFRTLLGRLFRTSQWPFDGPPIGQFFWPSEWPFDWPSDWAAVLQQDPFDREVIAFIRGGDDRLAASVIPTDSAIVAATLAADVAFRCDSFLLLAPALQHTHTHPRTCTQARMHARTYGWKSLLMFLPGFVCGSSIHPWLLPPSPLTSRSTFSPTLQFCTCFTSRCIHQQNTRTASLHNCPCMRVLLCPCLIAFRIRSCPR